MTEVAMKLRRISAIIVGLVFFVAGSLKLVDPVGAGLVVKDYLSFLHISFLSFAAKPIALIFAFAECICGAALLFGVFRRVASIFAFTLTGFFTVITLILAIANPPMDCGCFGEAVHLSNLQTFLKNIVLLILCLLAFVPLGKNRRMKPQRLGAFCFATILSAWLGIWSLSNVPLVEFTDFAIGKEIVKEETISENDFSATIIYSKDGEEKAFSLDALPDSTWTFVRTEVETASDGRASFDLGMPELSEGRYMLVDFYDPLALRGDYFQRLADFQEVAEDMGFKVMVLSDMDYKTLITLSRSNGGVVRVEDGIIIDKYPAGKLPDEEQLRKMDPTSALDDMMARRRNGRIRLQFYFAASILLILL
ncbi:MAG: hypothetical protein K5984_07055 [Bacteroidales bacterium]|nr:hypothetical protein [Bacteroidales bacterium]